MGLTVELMQDLDLRGKRVLIREDLNVPVKDGAVTSDARIRAALPTIEAARDAGAKVILMSHLGRPTEGEFDVQFSMAPVADHLAGLLGSKVTLVEEWRLGVELNEGEVALLENVRFNPGEKKDDEALARAYAGLCDVFVMDAFGTAHRRRLLPTGWPNMHRLPALVHCWPVNYMRWSWPCPTPRDRWWLSWVDPKYPPSSRCWKPCRKKSINWWSVEVSPTPSSLRQACR